MGGELRRAHRHTLAWAAVYLWRESTRGPRRHSLKVTAAPNPWPSVRPSVHSAPRPCDINHWPAPACFLPPQPPPPPRSIMPINADKMDGGCAERKRLRSAALQRRPFSFFLFFFLSLDIPPPHLPILPLPPPPLQKEVAALRRADKRENLQGRGCARDKVPSVQKDCGG